MFDLDGTLANTGEDLADSVNATRAHFDLGPLAAERIYAYVGRGVEHLLKHAVAERDGNTFPEVVRVFLRHYEEHLLDKTALYAGVRDTLEHFHNKRRVVVSNKMHRLTVAVVRGLGIAEQFDAIFGGDSAAEKKPHPALLHIALDRFGIAPRRAVMVGDGEIDVEAGRRAGVMTCGFAHGLGDRDQLIAAGPDVLIDHMIELQNHFD